MGKKIEFIRFSFVAGVDEELFGVKMGDDYLRDEIKKRILGIMDPGETKNIIKGNVDRLSGTSQLEIFDWVLGRSEGQPNLMKFIGECYYFGFGVASNGREALDWFLKSSKGGCIESMNSIGHLFRSGNMEGVELDYKMALKWYEKAGGSKNSDGWLNVGLLYQNGHGVEKDYAKAMEFYKKAAELGNSTAMYYVGNLYRKGLGVGVSAMDSIEWYTKAAELKNAIAMNQIGVIYQNGENIVEKDVGKAKKWFQKAIEQGSIHALCNVAGICREENRLVEAIKYYTIAYQNSEGDANVRLQCKGSITDLIKYCGMDVLRLFVMQENKIEKLEVKINELIEENEKLKYPEYI
ncbi:MAG: hypothetical protein Hyperionvirus18_38 [Hyperionvirus sp.]|uniref:Sel1 repeat family protein n=1 Tax=Hyperionvirus sp. TaxID=2487770 RepID=A0A3G5AAM6_9VIRU|nr:MAG: hypothetical protein Hyperionvirus18_38 [Hyperionvirus sp.]